MEYAYVCQNVANILRVINTVWIPFTNRPAPSLDARSKQDDGSAWEINNAERWHLFIIPSTLPQPLTQFWPSGRNIEYRLLLHVHKRSPVHAFFLPFCLGYCSFWVIKGTWWPSGEATVRFALGPFWKGVLWKERICSPWEQILSL